MLFIKCNLFRHVHYFHRFCHINSTELELCVKCILNKNLSFANSCLNFAFIFLFFRYLLLDHGFCFKKFLFVTLLAYGTIFGYNFSLSWIILIDSEFSKKKNSIISAHTSSFVLAIFFALIASLAAINNHSIIVIVIVCFSHGALCFI